MFLFFLNSVSWAYAAQIEQNSRTDRRYGAHDEQRYKLLLAQRHQERAGYHRMQSDISNGIHQQGTHYPFAYGVLVNLLRVLLRQLG